jgi:hypothetical protein
MERAALLLAAKLLTLTIPQNVTLLILCISTASQRSASQRHGV